MSTTGERIDMAPVGQVLDACAPAEPSPLVRTANPEEIMEDEAGMNPI